MEVGEALSSLAQKLFDLYPEAASLGDPSEHYPLHRLARIVGQTAGGNQGVATWMFLFRDVMEKEPSVADKPDTKGRPPLHILCFHLGDAAYDNEGVGQYERSSEFDDTVRFVDREEYKCAPSRR